MITDLSESKIAEFPEYDVCIVGSGPAGMTVANELKDAGLRICVLESGRLRPTRRGDRLRKVLSEGIRIKEYSRERVLGGASTTWSGLSGILDPIDMKPRPYLRYSGWPIPRDGLLPFYDEAAERYRFPSLSILGPDGLDIPRKKGDVQPSWGSLEEKIFMAAAEPQNFGREFRHIFDRENLDLYLDATLLRLECDEGKRRIARGLVRSRRARELRLNAAFFVLAAGGIENARLLLNSRDLCPEGLGNEHDQVGRYMMNHPKNYNGVIRLSRPVKELPYYFGCLYQGFAGYAGLRLKEEVQEGRGILNSYVRFEPLFPWSDKQGVEAFILIAKRCRGILKAWKGRKEDNLVSLRDYAETGDDTELQNERKTAVEWIGLFFKILVHFPHVVNYLYHRIVKKVAPDIRRVRLRNFMEMEPDPENRVALSEKKDIHGQPLPIVRHRCSDLDKKSLIALHETLAGEVSRNGFGELETRLHEEKTWPIDLDASHHMGTTRMGNDVRSSVVNADCRLHGVDNLYVAGASVFPTSGCANPTMTIVALSIRLAGHLREKVPCGTP